MTSHYLTLISLLLTLTITASAYSETSFETTLAYEEAHESADTEDFKDDEEKGEIKPLLEIASSFESKKTLKSSEDEIQARDSYSKPQHGSSYNKPYSHQKDETPKYDSFGSSYSHYGGSFYIPPNDDYKPPKQGSYNKPPKEGGYGGPYSKPYVEVPKPHKEGGYGGSQYQPPKEVPKPIKEGGYGGSFYKPPKEESKPVKDGGYGGSLYKPPKEEPKPPKEGGYGPFYKPSKEEPKPPKEGGYGGPFYKPPKQEPKPPKDGGYGGSHYKPPKEEHHYLEHYHQKPSYDSPFSKPQEHYKKPEEDHHHYPHKDFSYPDDDPYQHYKEDREEKPHYEESFQPVPTLSVSQYKDEQSKLFKREDHEAKTIKDLEPEVEIKARSKGSSLQSIIDNVFGTTSPSLAETLFEATTQEAVVDELTVQKKYVPFKGAGCSGYKMECIPYYLCKNGTLNRKGGGVVDIRIGDDEKEPECPFLEECCSLSSKTKTASIKVPPKEEGCGYRNPEGVGFKISGARDHESEFGEFPWMVAIIKQPFYTNNPSLFQCGGSVIHPKVVLTAAHCVHKVNIKNLRARGGEWDTQTTAEIVPYQDREIEGIVVHKYYSLEEGLVNDIALLFLKTPFDLAENVNPICLPPKHLKFDYSKCLATGWGKDSFAKDGRYSTILKKVELPVVPNEKCEQILKTTRLEKYFELDDSFMCAGGEEGLDTCQGDGGSPLVCPIEGHKNRYYQAGIVAWGIGCNDPIPAVYANVAYLRPWIDEQLNLRGIESSHYTLF